MDGYAHSQSLWFIRWKRIGIHGPSTVELGDYVREILAVGFPQAQQLSDRARSAWLDDYIERVITPDFTEQGLRIRRPELLRGWLRGYNSATASTTTFSKVGASLNPGEPTGPTRKTSIAYRDVLSSLYLLDRVDAWSPNQKPLKRAALAPKQFLGDFFEALVALSFQTCAAANDAQVSHFRAHDGQGEIDVIVHRGYTEAVGFEVKFEAPISDHDGVAVIPPALLTVCGKARNNRATSPSTSA